MNSYFIDVGAVSTVIDIQQLFHLFVYLIFWPKTCSGHGRYGRYASYATAECVLSAIGAAVNIRKQLEEQGRGHYIMNNNKKM